MRTLTPTLADGFDEDDSLWSIDLFINFVENCSAESTAIFVILFLNFYFLNILLKSKIAPFDRLNYVINLLLVKLVDSTNFICKDYGMTINELYQKIAFKRQSTLFILYKYIIIFYIFILLDFYHNDLPPRQFFRHLCVEEARRASSLISILIEVFFKVSSHYSYL